MKSLRIPAVLLALFVFCSSHLVAEDETITLPSGNKIEILSSGRVELPTGGVAYEIKYQSHVNFDDREAVRHEMDQIWARFIYDIEKLNLTTAVLHAHAALSSDIVTGGHDSSTVLKKVNGKWEVAPVPISEKRPDKLTNDMINQTIHLWDATSSDLNVDATLLYLAPDWSCTVTEKTGGQEKSQSMDWKQLEKSTRGMIGMLASYKSERSNTRIDIAPDGQTATVASTITEKLTGKDGRIVSSVTETSDILELADGRVLVQSSLQTELESKATSEMPVKTN